MVLQIVHTATEVPKSLKNLRNKKIKNVTYSFLF